MPLEAYRHAQQAPRVPPGMQPTERKRSATAPEGFGAEFFVARGISLTQIRVTEGCLVVANAENIPRLEGRLTAYARLALKAFGIDT